MRYLFGKEGPSTQAYKGRIEQISIDLVHAYIFLSAVTFGAGVQWYEAYDYVDEQGRFIVGGLSQESRRFRWLCR